MTTFDRNLLRVAGVILIVAGLTLCIMVFVNIGINEYNSKTHDSVGQREAWCACIDNHGTQEECDKADPDLARSRRRRER